MVRDEADCIEGTIRHMADEVDRLLVADNNSVDGTRDILHRLAAELPPGRLLMVDQPETAYYQSRHMTALATIAGEAGAEWICPFDADELWVAQHRIGDLLPALDVPIAHASLFNHLRTAVDEPHPDPFRSMVWRAPTAAPLPKVAFRWEPGCVIHQGNHDVTRPSGGEAAPALVIRHFPYRSLDQFERKVVNGAAAYRGTDLPESTGNHWRTYGQLYDRLGRAALEEVFRTHFHYVSPVDSGLVHDPAPYRRWAR